MAEWGSNRQHRRSAAGDYDVFLSYHHRSAADLAKALENGLRSLGKGTFERRALHVFRDQSSLSATPELWPTIEKALTASTAYVLLASPESAASTWVSREVAWWAENRSRDRFFIVLCDGNLVWRGDDFDWDLTTALPRGPLSGFFVDEPLWVDLRDLTGQGSVDPTAPVLQDGVAAISSAVQGRPKEDLFSDDLRAHRRTLLLTRLAALALTLLTVVALAAAVVSVRQRNVAVRQQQIALSRQLAAQAVTLRDQRPAEALMLSLEALRVRDTAEARGSLQGTLTQNPFQKIVVQGKAIRSVAFSPDSRLLATAGDNDTVILWDISGPLNRRRIADVPSDGAGKVLFSPDGQRLIISGNALQIWDISDPSRPTRLSSTTEYAGPGLSLSADGLVLATSAQVWNLADPAHPRLVTSLPDGPVRDASLRPDGKVLAVASSPDHTFLWDLRRPGHPALLATLPVMADSVTYSPDGKLLLVLPPDAPAQVWNVRDLTSPRRLSVLRKAKNSPTFMATFSPDSKTVVTADYSGTGTVWNMTFPQQPVEKTILTGHTNSAWATAISNDGRLIATGSADGTAIVWKLATSVQTGPTARLTGFEEPSSTTFSPDSKYLVTGGDWFSTNTSGIWRVTGTATPLRVSRFPLRFTTAVYSKDGKRLITTGQGEQKEQFAVWDVSDAERPRLLTALSGSGKWMAISPAGNFVTTATEDDHVRLQAFDSQHKLRFISQFPGYEVIFSPDERLLATASSKSGKTTLWRMSTGSKPKEVGTVPGPVTAIGPGSRLAVTHKADSDEVLLWDVTDPGHPRRASRIPGSGAAQASFSPDGRTLAIGDSQGSPTLWSIADPAHPRVTGRLLGHHGSAYLVTFSPDGNMLATGGFDKNVLLWNFADMAAAQDPVRLACAVAGPGLSRDQWERLMPEQPYHRTCP